MKKNKTIFIIIGIITLLILILILINNKKTIKINNISPEINNKKTEMILFYSDTCPHCEKVSTFIKENNIKSNLDFEELEVGKNKENAKLLLKKAQKCNLDLNSGIGVPFFFTGEECLIGDGIIINYLTNK